MSDVTEAPTQDAIADSLLPESEQQSVEAPEAEQQVEEQVQEQPQEVEQQDQVEETAEDWLPTDQDKVFPDEVLQRYCQRYGLDENILANPQLRQLVTDKINTDIFVQQQRQQEEQQQYEPEPQPEPTRTEPQLTREQYFQNLDRMIDQRTDPEVAKDMYVGFMKVFGVPDAEIAKLAPTQAMPFVKILSRGALNLMNTFMDDMLGARLQQHVSQAYPGFGEMYERSSYAMAWDRVRNSDPKYQSLPSYGTKEFSSTLRQAAARVPGFDEMQFTGQDGQPLPPMENSMRKYSMLAQIASGQNVDPRLVQQAAAAGARNAKRAQATRTNGNLGSGQSKAATGSAKSSKFETNEDLFDDATMELYKKEHGRL